MSSVSPRQCGTRRPLIPGIPFTTTTHRAKEREGRAHRLAATQPLAEQGG